MSGEHGVAAVPAEGLKIPPVVIEDRGPPGQGGKQIVRVRFLTDIVAPYEESESRAEIPERGPGGALNSRGLPDADRAGFISPRV